MALMNVPIGPPTARTNTISNRAVDAIETLSTANPISTIPIAKNTRRRFSLGQAAPGLASTAIWRMNPTTKNAEMILTVVSTS